MRLEVVVKFKNKEPVKLVTDDFESPNQIYELLNVESNGLVFLKGPNGGILAKREEIIGMEVNEVEPKVVEPEVFGPEDEPEKESEQGEEVKEKLVTVDLSVPAQYRSFREEFIRTAYSGQTLRNGIIEKMKKKNKLLKKANEVMDKELVELQGFIEEQVVDEED